MRDPQVIHVVRHGRTRSNRVGLVMGWVDESIEPDQHDAVDAVAARLAAAPAPVRVVSSPLARARDTAAPLAAALSVDLETDARLGELYQGPWQGLAESEVARRWPLEWSVWRTAPETLDLDGRETLTALYARVADAFDDLVVHPMPRQWSCSPTTQWCGRRWRGRCASARPPIGTSMWRTARSPRSTRPLLARGWLPSTTPATCPAANDEPCRVDSTQIRRKSAPPVGPGQQVTDW